MRNIQVEALHDFLNTEINKAIYSIREHVANDNLNADAMLRLATEINCMERIKAKFHKEE